MRSARSESLFAASLPRRRPSTRTLKAVRPISVLVVDDDAAAAQAVVRLLSADPTIAVQTCLDPSEAIELVERCRPTVILQDMVMPGCDGLALLGSYRGSLTACDVPVIVLSSEECPTVKADAFAAGADDYLVKFPDQREMQARVRHHASLYLRGVEHDEAVLSLAQSRRDLDEQGQVLRQTIERYLSSPVVERLLSSPDGLELGGETRQVTILMTDLRGFTPLNERLAPERMVTLLNNYLEVMTAVILRHQGTIDEFIGDAILVLFGAPEQRSDDAERAVACAVEMQRAMAQVNAKNRALGLPAVEMGIGLDTGMVAVGNIGSRSRAKYGVVGSAINRAARIESYTTGGQVLVSQATLDAAGGHVVAAGRVEVSPKGVQSPFFIHEVLGIGGPYDLHLQAAPAPLTAPAFELNARFVVLDGKDAGGQERCGRVVRLSAEAAEITATPELPALVGLKLRLATPDCRVLAEALYAKVTGPGSGAGTFTIRFTSVPPDVAAVLAQATAAPP
jgi:adenylate cyclase